MYAKNLIPFPFFEKKNPIIAISILIFKLWSNWVSNFLCSLPPIPGSSDTVNKSQKYMFHLPYNFLSWKYYCEMTAPGLWCDQSYYISSGTFNTLFNWVIPELTSPLTYMERPQPRQHTPYMSSISAVIPFYSQAPSAKLGSLLPWNRRNQEKYIWEVLLMLLTHCKKLGGRRSFATDCRGFWVPFNTLIISYMCCRLKLGWAYCMGRMAE